MPHGGKRPGAGRRKDTETSVQVREQRSIEKAVLREETRRLIAPHLPRLIAAQIENGAGLKYVVTRDKKTGKFLRVGPAQAANPTEETIEVWEKDPSVQAFTDLMNRVIDKPAEQELQIKLSADHELLARLDAGRQRARD